MKEHKFLPNDWVLLVRVYEGKSYLCCGIVRWLEMSEDGTEFSYVVDCETNFIPLPCLVRIPGEMEDCLVGLEKAKVDFRRRSSSDESGDIAVIWEVDSCDPEKWPQPIDESWVVDVEPWVPEKEET